MGLAAGEFGEVPLERPISLRPDPFRFRKRRRQRGLAIRKRRDRRVHLGKPRREVSDPGAGLLCVGLLARDIRVKASQGFIGAGDSLPRVAEVAVDLFPLQQRALMDGGGDRLLLPKRRERFRRLQRFGRRRRGRSSGLLVSQRRFRDRRARGALGFSRLAPGEVEDGGAQAPDLGGDLLVLGGGARFAAQAGEARFQFAFEVGEAGEVGFRRADLDLRLVATSVKTGDARRLLQDAATVLRARGDQLRDLPLTHQSR